MAAALAFHVAFTHRWVAQLKGEKLPRDALALKFHGPA